MILLFPGRHVINTKFQEDYLFQNLQLPIEQLKFLGASQKSKEKINQIVFAITSCNKDNSRYNPLPFHIRAIEVDRFAAQFREKLNINYRIIGVPHFDPTEKFAQNILKEINEQTEGDIVLNPKNTIVLCSTPEVIDLYKKIGFSILPGELLSSKPEKYCTETPAQIIKKIVNTKELISDKELRQKLSSATLSVLIDFPEIFKKMIRLYKDPLLTDAGSITETRNYSTYAYGMGKKEVIELKYNDIKEGILPGKIVDEGCADGALLSFVAKDFPDSDLIGIEITGEFIARCKERQRTGDFGGTYVFFHQRNITKPIFEANSIDTTICNSTVHELWSYNKQALTLNEYLTEKFNQTRKGGRLIIRDVVGPENKDNQVYMWCNEKDGNNKNILKHFSNQEMLKKHLDKLSTHARFLRFAKEYLEDMRHSNKRGEKTKIAYSEKKINGKNYFKLKLKAAVEFMTKKDYTDNWKSELNEEFAFWSFKEWKIALKNAGFAIIENPNESNKSSRAYTNKWIVENRFKNKVALYTKIGKNLKIIEYPVTNMILIGEKIK